VFQRFHLPAIERLPTVELVAACDPQVDRLAWAQHRSPPPALFGAPEELARCPGLEAVLVLTPPESHAQATVQCLESGLHVLVEKPMALDLAEARRMEAAARRAQRRLHVGFTRRFRDPYRHLREAVRQLDPRLPRAVRFELAFPPSWNSRTGFLGDESRGGGVLDDVLSHQVDLVSWVLGLRPDAVRTAALSASAASMRAELRIGGILARCDAAHGRYAERFEIELADGRLFEATGSRMRRTRPGFAPWRRQRALLLDRLALVGARLRRRPNVTLASFELQLRDFEGAIRGRGFQGATAEEGLHAVDIVQACRASARQGGAWQSPELGATPAA
jgi:predicted dehydrogenase